MAPGLMELHTFMDNEDHRVLSAEIEAFWPRIDRGEASLEEVRALALAVFDKLGVTGLDRWEKHHFVWVLKGLATNRHTPGAGLYTALHGLEQALAPTDEREPPGDETLDDLREADLRKWVAAA